MSYEKKYEFNGPWLMNKDKIPALQKEVEENFNNLEEKVDFNIANTKNAVEMLERTVKFADIKEIRKLYSELQDYLDSATTVVEVGGDQFNRKRERTFSDKLLRIDFDKAKKDLDYFVKRNTDRIECTIIPNQHRHEKEIGELKDKFKELNEILIHNAEQDKENQDYYENKVKELESFCADNKESWSDTEEKLDILKNANTKDIVNLEQKVKFIEKQLGEYKNKASTDNQVNNWYTHRLDSLRNDLNTTITRVNDIANVIHKNTGYRGWTFAIDPAEPGKDYTVAIENKTDPNKNVYINFDAVEYVKLLHEKNQEIDKLKTEFEKANKEIKKDKFEEMSKTTNEYIKLLNEKRDIENKLEIEIKNKWKLQEEVNKTTSEYVKLLNEKKDAVEEVARLKYKLEKTNTELLQALGDSGVVYVGDRKEGYRFVSKKYQDLQNNVDVLRKEVDKLQEKNNNLVLYLDGSNIKNLRDEINRLETEKSNLEEFINRQLGTDYCLIANKRVHKDVFEKWEQGYKSKQQEIDRLNKDLKQANKEMIEYYNKYIEAQQKLNAIKDNLK